jgi:hypothetical protein
MSTEKMELLFEGQSSGRYENIRDEAYPVFRLTLGAFTDVPKRPSTNVAVF